MKKLVTSRIRPAIGALITAKAKEDKIGGGIFIPGLNSQESQFHPPFLSSLPHQTPTAKRTFKASQKYKVKDDIFKQCFPRKSQSKRSEKSGSKSNISGSKAGSGHLLKDLSNFCCFYDRKLLRKLLLNANFGTLEFPRSKAAVNRVAEGATKVISSLERRLSCSEEPCKRKGRMAHKSAQLSLGSNGSHSWSQEVEEKNLSRTTAKEVTSTVKVLDSDVVHLDCHENVTSSPCIANELKKKLAFEDFSLGDIYFPIL